MGVPVARRNLFAEKGRFAISVAGVAFAVLLMLIVERGHEFPLPFILAGVCLCLALFVVFIRIERAHDEPLLPLDLGPMSQTCFRYS